MFGRDKLAVAAQELANHLQLVDHVKALQEGQKALGDGIAALGDRLRALELEMSTLKAETKLDALREAQNVVFAVQSGLNQRIEDLAVQVAVFEATGLQPSFPDRTKRQVNGLQQAPAGPETPELIQDQS